MYKVYIRINNENKVYDINSESFIQNLNDWIYIDEGVGKKYYYAQQAYLPKSIYDENGILRYYYINNELIERSEEERLIEFKERFPGTNNTNDLEERVTTLENSLATYETAYYQGVNEA